MYCCYTWTSAAFYPREGAQKIAHKNFFDGVRTNPNNLFFVYFQHINARIVKIILFGASNAKGEFLNFRLNLKAFNASAGYASKSFVGF